MISRAVLNVANLEVLRLTESRIEDEQLRIMARALLRHPALRVLDLRHNRLKDKSGRALGKLISTLKTLRELDLEDNEIGLEGCGAIAHALKKDQEMSHNISKYRTWEIIWPGIYK